MKRARASANAKAPANQIKMIFTPTSSDMVIAALYCPKVNYRTNSHAFGACSGVYTLPAIPLL